MPTKRVLFLAAEPTDSVRLRLGREQRAIRDALRKARAGDDLEFTERVAVRPADLTQAFQEVRPQVVHFSGPGRLGFTDDAGRTRPAGPDALAALFEPVREDVEAVVLNGCYAERQARAIAGHIRWVIGADDGEGQFAAGFYKALGAGHDYRTAAGFGEAEMRLHGVPVLVAPRVIERRPAHFRSAGPAGHGLARFAIDRDHADAVHVDPTGFASIRDLIETLHGEYLADQVPPQSYGQEWIIADAGHSAVLIAPAAWVKQPSTPAYQVAPAWADELTLADAGIVAGTRWNLRLRRSHGPALAAPIAVAAADPGTARLLRTHPKGIHLIDQRLTETDRFEDLASVPAGQVVVLESEYRAGRWYVDRGGPMPEHARWYLRGNA